MRRILALILFLLPLSVGATTTVTGHISDLTGTALTTGTFARFNLRGCAGNQPRVDGVALIAPSQGAVWYKDFPVDSSGNISGTIYSTRDSTGLLGGDIDCGGSELSEWYGLVIYQGGKAGPETPIHALSGVVLNVTSVQPIISTPPPPVLQVVGPPGAPGATGPPGTLVSNSGITVGGPIIIKGPGPFADIGAFGARSVSSPPISAMVSCASSMTQTFPVDPVGLGFQVGDGVTIYGCGATPASLATPGAVAVVPSEAAGETGTEYVVNSPTGVGNSYSYCIFARDKFGAVTPCSATTTISNGLPMLGLQAVNITSLTRSGDVVTAVTAANQLVPLAAVQVESTASKAFNGWFSVGSITSGTTFVLNATPIDTRAQSWQVGDVASVGSGGRVAYMLGNHLSWTYSAGAWEYYVCAQRPGDGAKHLIGVTKPSNSPGYRDVQFDDWGSPYMDGQSYPTYITDANCTGAATNDPLTTSITAINSGAKTITTHDSASQNLASTTAIFDDGPAILAAATSQSLSAGNGGTVNIPPAPSGQAYFINSYTKLPSNIAIVQSGYLALRETVEVDTGVNWNGDWGTAGVPQFAYGSGPGIETAGSYPGIYVNGFGNSFRGLNLYTAGLVTNGGTIVVADNPNGTNFNHVNFSTGVVGGSTTDYLSTGLVWRDTSNTVDNMTFDTVLFTSGPDQVTDKSWQCLLCMMPGQNGAGVTQNIFYEFKMNNAYWNRRGMALASFGGGGTFEIDNLYRQGGITPMFAFQSQNICTSCASFIFTNEAQDTEGEPVIANLYSVAASDIPIGTTVVFNTVAGANSQGPLISGTRPTMFKMDGYVYANALNIPNRDAAINGFGQTFTYAPYATGGASVPVAGGLQTFTEPAHIPSGHSFYFDLQPPTSVAAGAPTSGGSIPVGTWYYAVNATGPDGGETIVSLPSAPVTTSSGNQTVAVTWAPVAGAYSYNIYRCQTSCLMADGTASNTVLWTRLAQHQSGTTYSDAAASGTAVVIPQVTGTGSTVQNSTGSYAPFFQAPPITVSQLPAAAAGNAGQVRRVTDSTTVSSEGQTCVGSGAVTALAFSNGTVWKCF